MKHLKEKFIAAAAGTTGFVGGVLLGSVPVIGGAFATAAAAAATAVVSFVGVPVLIGAGAVSAAAVAGYQVNKRVIKPRRQARRAAKKQNALNK